MNGALQVVTLGGLSIQRQDVPRVKFHSRKTEALVVYLFSTRQPQSRDVLADLLWEDRSQASANLRVLLTDLRQFLAPYFVITRSSVELNPAGEYWFDAAAFQAHLDTAQRLSRHGQLTRASVAELERALALYQGDFLKGFYIRESPRFEEWVLLEQERLRRRAVNALQDLTAYYLERREYALGIQAARRLFEIDPLNELTQQQLMQLLARSGEHHAALAHYDKYKQLLAAELNAEPSPHTTALRDQIQAGTLVEKISRSVRSPLPRTLTPFLGRARELAELEEKLKDTHIALVTLLGPGGVGKTRLALRTAENVYSHFGDGVAFVALASVSDPNLVVTTIAETLGVPEKGGETILHRLKEHLCAQELLLLLDNFEQVVAAAPVLSELLTACAHLKILVTSREKLHLYGEHEFPVAPLPFPPLTTLSPDAADLVTQIARYPAVALFVQRASASQPDFKLVPGNARAVAEVCARLDGLPLAIELAAARINLLTPQEMLTQLTNRLNLLSAGERDRAPRHQTIRGAIDWSYDLLNSAERKLFRQLSVFVGGCDFQAAATLVAPQETVSPLTLQLLDSLVNKSLVQRTARAAGEPRFIMLETLREYARECLEQHDETAAVERQHALYMLNFVRAAELELQGPSQVQRLNQCEAELDNLRAALQWALKHNEPAIGIEMVSRSGRFWTVHDHWAEGRRWLEQLQELPQADVPLLVRARGLHSVGLLAHWMFDYDAANRYLRRALELAEQLDDERTLAQILLAQSSALQVIGELDQAAVALEQGVRILRELGLPQDVGWCYLSEAGLQFQLGNFESSRQLFAQAVADFQQQGDHWGAGIATSFIAIVAMLAGDVQAAGLYKAQALALLTQVGDMARVAVLHFFVGSPLNEPSESDAELEFFQEQFRLSTRRNDKPTIARAGVGLASAFHRRGQQAQASELFRATLTLFLDLGDELWAIECIEGLARVAAAQQQHARAVRLFAATAALRRLLNISLIRAGHGNYGTALASAKSQLGETEFNALWVEGCALSLKQATEYAVTTLEQEA